MTTVHFTLSFLLSLNPEDGLGWEATCRREHPLGQYQQANICQMGSPEVLTVFVMTLHSRRVSLWLEARGNEGRHTVLSAHKMTPVSTPARSHWDRDVDHRLDPRPVATRTCVAAAIVTPRAHLVFSLFLYFPVNKQIIEAMEEILAIFQW